MENENYDAGPAHRSTGLWTPSPVTFRATAAENLLSAPRTAKWSNGAGELRFQPVPWNVATKPRYMPGCAQKRSRYGWNSPGNFGATIRRSEAAIAPVRSLCAR